MRQRVMVYFIVLLYLISGVYISCYHLITEAALLIVLLHIHIQLSERVWSSQL